MNVLLSACLSLLSFFSLRTAFDCLKEQQTQNAMIQKSAEITARSTDWIAKYLVNWMQKLPMVFLVSLLMILQLKKVSIPEVAALIISELALTLSVSAL